jgi:hypothetical protein
LQVAESFCVAQYNNVASKLAYPPSRVPALQLSGGVLYVSFSLNCRNCSDKRYYSSAVNGALGVAAPRTISFSVRIAGL